MTDESTHTTEREGFAGMTIGTCLNGKQPGVNVDRVDRAAGIAMLRKLGWDDERTLMVIDYALWRHGHGEEAAAEKGAIDTSFHGIDFTSWRMVLAAACASGERNSWDGGESNG